MSGGFNRNKIEYIRLKWSILENVLCALETNVYSYAIVWNVLYMSVRFNWSVVLLKSTVFLLIFYMNIYPVLKVGYWFDLPIIILFSISPFSSINICFKDLISPISHAYIFIIDMNLTLYLYSDLVCLLWLILTESLFYLI